jgi:signal transduction histidine kinase
MNKAKREIIYSVAVLLIIPALLAFNTILLATSIRKDYDKELQSRAELSNSVLAETLNQTITTEQPEVIQEKINSINDAQNELRNITIVTKTGENYTILATTSEDAEISNSDKLQYDIVYARKWPVAKNIAAFTDGGDSTRAWNVASPVIDDNKKVIGIVASDLLTVDVDERFDATLNRSLWIMLASAVAVVVLLFNHFRFIGYASLLRKQQELNQTMSDFLSVATHELKAPMTIIKGYISNVTDGDFGNIPQEAKEQLDVAVAQTDRLNELVQDLLNVSRIEQGRITFDIKSINLRDVITPLVNSYQKIAKEKDITIIYEQTDAVWAAVDSGRAQEIFTNLIDNAVKYSKSGTVTIKHEIDSRFVLTSVRDSGIGMSAEERSRLFQRFYRVKNDHTKNIQGTGLGLWIIKQYIEKMGGTISVDSLVGSGTEFRVALRKAPPAE